MAAFATRAELARYMRAEVEDEAAELVLSIASRKIRSVCGWSITREHDVVETLDGSGGPLVWLTTLLVTSVTSVTDSGRPLNDGVHYRWWSNGKLQRINGCWSPEPRSIVAKYTHGHDPVPDDVKGVCLSLAARMYQNPNLVRSYTLGAVSETFSDAEVGPSLTETELNDLGPYLLLTL